MAKNLLLFIHGFGGRPRKSWGNFESLIRDDPELGESFDVDYYSYQTNILPWGSKTKIQHLANGLKTEIDNRYSQHSSIILICHSLGGLVAKKYIVDQLLSKSTLRVNGVILFATPNKGVGLSKIIRFLPWWSWRSWQLIQLCSNSDFIEFLEHEWTQLKPEDRVNLKYVVAGNDWVVNRKSAEGDAEYRDIEEINQADHRSIVKPKDSDSLAFKVVKRFVLELPIVVRSEDEIRQALRRHAKQQLSILKSSGKYIPNVFVDRANLRDRVRYCALPDLFSHKIVEDIKRLDFRLVSRFLHKYPIENINFSFPDELQSPIGEESVGSFCAKLNDWLLDKSDALSRLKSYDIHSDDVPEQIPDKNQYTWEHRKYHSHRYAYKHLWKIESVLEKLNLLKAPGVVITSAAGRGKTNFLCDLVEKVLIPRRVPALFLTASELSRVNPEKIWQYVATNVLYDKAYEDFDHFCSDYDKLFQMDKQPLVLIIDGLSEHRQLEEFVNQLILLTQRLLAKPYLRFIFTCRSEYFKDRFKDMKTAFMPYDIVFIEDFDKRVTDAEKSILKDAYFEHFKLDCEISDSAMKQLTSDPLFLRVFCETYGDPTSQNAIKLQPIHDIYKDKVFKDFLRRKENEVFDRARGSQSTYPIRRSRLRELLISIAKFMVDTRTFADLPISKLSLPSQQLDLLDRIIDEGLLLRTDLAPTTDAGALDTNTEVLNFTMDEFRDFFIADYLWTVTLPQSTSVFCGLVDAIVAPECFVAEGVRRFLFRMGKSAKTQELITIIESRPWYDEVFLDEVFEIEDTHVTQKDVDKLASLFIKSPANAHDVLLQLWNRFDSILYPNLNTSMILRLCYPLSDEQYDTLIAPILTGSEEKYYHIGSPVILINPFIDALADALTDTKDDLSTRFHIAIRTIVFCLGAKDIEVHRSAQDLLCDYVIEFPDYAEDLLLQSFRQLVSSVLRGRLLMVLRNVHDRDRQLSSKFYVSLVSLLRESDNNTVMLSEIVRSLRALAGGP